MAPSEGLVGAIPGGGYVSWSGTSGAAPIVAGIAALVRAAYPRMSADNVINRILVSARPVSDQVPDPLYGYGLVNAYEALTREVPSVSANPLGTLDAWITLHRKQEGSPTIVPLGPAGGVAVKEPASPAPVALVLDTRRETLPYLVSGGFAVALLVVLSVGIARVLLARPTR
jgi:membrane-anchored mycosin MYCP